MRNTDIGRIVQIYESASWKFGLEERGRVVVLKIEINKMCLVLEFFMNGRGESPGNVQIPLKYNLTMPLTMAKQ